MEGNEVGYSKSANAINFRVVLSAFYGNHRNIFLAQDAGSDNRNVYKCHCIPTRINPDTFYITVYMVTKNCGLQDTSEFGTSKLTTLTKDESITWKCVIPIVCVKTGMDM